MKQPIKWLGMNNFRGYYVLGKIALTYDFNSWHFLLKN